MRDSRRGPWLLMAAVALASCSTSTGRPPAAVGVSPSASLAILVPKAPAILAPAPSALTGDQRILHVLNRLGYGPRPGDLERVKRMGLASYIERQLEPTSIPDEALDAAVRGYRTLTMSAAELVEEYPRPKPQAVTERATGEHALRPMRQAFPLERRPYRIIEEMQAAKLTRAVLSERQLNEVMVDFWFNHFNVFGRKGPIPWMVPAFEREAIRPYALGRFRDLLLATARHPAMLFYLDNWLSTHAEFVLPRGPNKGRKLGLNENYARELMELHTLGVDGGYSQHDVIEVARCFTGWTIDRPQQGGGFIFRIRPHDQGAKQVLGHVIPGGGGEQDGLRVIDILARHPSTARFISTKLLRRFVTDDPPSGLIDRVARTFRDTDGDIRAVLASIFTSAEFLSAEAYRAKIKTPLELVASAVRALGAEISPGPETTSPVLGAVALARQVAKLGEPLYEAQPPTGYADRAEAWINAGALLNRMNFALALAQNRFSGVHVDLETTLRGADRCQPERVLDRLVEAVLHGESCAQTRAALAAELSSSEVTRATDSDPMWGNADVQKLAALVIGSPEFQRR